MIDANRKEEFDKVLDTLMSLETALEDAGGASVYILKKHLDLPLRDFLAQVCSPNGIRFYHMKKGKPAEDVSSAEEKKMDTVKIFMEKTSENVFKDNKSLYVLYKDNSDNWVLMRSGQVVDAKRDLSILTKRNGVVLYDYEEEQNFGT